MKSVFKIGPDAQSKLKKSLDGISKAVGSTMGPGGRPFGFDKLGTDMRLTATFSKDGLTVLKALRFDDPSDNAVLQYCKQAASHSVLASGDGTTSTIILANAIAKAVLDSGEKWPQAFARRVEQDANEAIRCIRNEAIISDEATRKVALTSTNGDEELTDVVIDAIKNSAAFGTILVEKNPASSERYRIERQDGYSNCKGYDYNNTFALSASPNAASQKAIEWDNPKVAVFNGNLLVKNQITPILNAWNDGLKKGESGNLLIIAFEVSDEIVNELLVLNRQFAKHGAAVFVSKPRLTAEVNAPLQIMRDMAAFCGVSEDSILDGGNLKDVTLEYFGTCGQVKITPSNTMFLGRAKNHWVDKRIKQNESIVKEARSQFDREITSVRNAELAEGLVKVQVGGGMLPDLQERADRFDDASKAAQACMKSGALPGCGVSYIRAAALAAVHPSIEEAFRSIHETVLTNYGTESNPNLLLMPGQGVQISDNGVEVGPALKLGILDACETVCAVIRNGVSLGVKIATIGGYSYRSKEDEQDFAS